MSKKNKLYALVAIILVILAIASYSVFAYVKNNESNKTSKSQQDVLGTNSKTEISYKGKDGVSALDLLKQNAKVVTSGEDASAFVTSIDGLSAKSNEFWQLSIDGEPAMVGAGSYITKSSESITWKLTTF